MPFELIPRANAAAKARTKPNEVTLRTMKVPARAGGGTTKTGIVFDLGTDVTRRLSWKPDQAVQILWGSGSDQGKVKLVACEPGSKVWQLRPNKAGTSAKVLTCSLPANRAPRDWTATPLQHDVIGEVRPPAIVLYLPREFFAVPAADEAPPAPAAGIAAIDRDKLSELLEQDKDEKTIARELGVPLARVKAEIKALERSLGA